MTISEAACPIEKLPKFFPKRQKSSEIVIVTTYMYTLAHIMNLIGDHVILQVILDVSIVGL